MSHYFWPFGKCLHCGWPHHYRIDRPARPKRLWRRAAAPAVSFVQCCNCGLRTPIEADR